MRVFPDQFLLESAFKPTGDQPQAIETLVKGLKAGKERLVLEGVTGSGKTFTMANLIQAVGKQTLIISHNKTLAAQLYAELKAFFPKNAVEYFISYYDYYQPEAYIPQTDTYIEKDASVNDEIERFRLGATNALIGRKDVIVVASVSCIYGLGEPESYKDMLIEIREGLDLPREQLLMELIKVQYQRNDYDPQPGMFRVRGDTVDIFPSYDTNAIRVEFFGDTIDSIRELDPVSGHTGEGFKYVVISPAKHFVLPQEKIVRAIDRISSELDSQLAFFEEKGKLLEAQRLRQRTEFDMEMLRQLGYCNGIENYSRHLGGRNAGDPPACLMDYFNGDFLTIIDESHVTLPQLRAMYNGDQARKHVLVDNGFRLPSALDNRPLNFDEFMGKVGPVVFASATPGAFERQVAEVTAEQVIRPTGLLDPPIEIRPLANQIDDLMEEVRRCAEAGDRVLVTTLTKRSAEDLTAYLHETGLRVEYLHSGIDAIERVEILSRLRKGEFDCLIGINLLREGLDLPEVALVAVLDADKEGFLRSTTSLIQTAGRTARHLHGRVILYADHETDAMREMIAKTRERRAKQEAYNREHNITPTSVKRALNDTLNLYDEAERIERASVSAESPEVYDIHRTIASLETEMLQAADALEFERAAILRDEISDLKQMLANRTGQNPTPFSRTKPKRTARRSGARRR
ncbi:MAG: excinuclease ABC subunit UvrB [Kiritimatiellae bacterium]|nr:excinuclease ABC subunit UvrB [Kiritimatiellia bacterium]MBP5226994.1 excinuclease ABC subunit UvrB [Kiritimatiellia bacterium]